MKTISAIWACGVFAMGCATEPAELTGSMEQQAGAPAVFHSTFKGASADVGFWEPLGGGWVGVWTDDGAQLTTLNYGTYAYSEDFTRQHFEYAWGNIPNNDLTRRPHEVTLRTTLGPHLEGMSCDYDFASFVFTCSPTSHTGDIAVTWQPDGFTSYFQSGTSMYTYGAVTFRSQGTFRTRSAQVEGSFLGRDLAGAVGWLGENRGTNVSKDVLLAP